MVSLHLMTKVSLCGEVMSLESQSKTIRQTRLRRQLRWTRASGVSWRHRRMTRRKRKKRRMKTRKMRMRTARKKMWVVASRHHSPAPKLPVAFTVRFQRTWAPGVWPTSSTCASNALATRPKIHIIHALLAPCSTSAPSATRASLVASAPTIFQTPVVGLRSLYSALIVTTEAGRGRLEIWTSQWTWML